MQATTSALSVLQLADGAENAALDLHKGITDPGSLGGCKRWPDGLLLESTLGHLVKGRCRATNLCDYCARLAAIENTEVLALDALHGIAPRIWAVLTTRRADLDPASFYRSREQLAKALRRRWPSLEWSALVEFTTGYGANSGGRRRPHWNLLLKGVGPEDVAAIRDVIESVWCPRVDARPEGQHVGEIGQAEGLMRYLALHFQKESQAPPAGWSGHRFLKSRGYLWLPTPQAREQARASLNLKRELWKAEAAGHEGAGALAIAEREAWERSELAWELVRVMREPAGYGEDGIPTLWRTSTVPVR